MRRSPAYARRRLCLEEMFGVGSRRGRLFYGDNGGAPRWTSTLNSGARRRVSPRRMHELSAAVTPSPSMRKSARVLLDPIVACRDSLSTRRRDVARRYMAKALTDGEDRTFEATAEHAVRNHAGAYLARDGEAVLCGWNRRRSYGFRFIR